MSYRGQAHLFGDDVNTDYITPTDYFGESMETIAAHVFEPIAPDFHDRFEPGDLIVAGENFGSGSSRETAPRALAAAGVGAVIAASFARIFYRNGVAIGLPCVVCPAAPTLIEDGDTVAVDLAARTVTNETADTSATTEPMAAALREIFDAGGLVAHYMTDSEGLGD